VAQLLFNGAEDISVRRFQSLRPTPPNIFASGDGCPFWPFFENVRSWWGVRDLPNVLTLHLALLKRDLASEIRRFARFLEIPIEEARFPAIVEHCSFDYMKKNAVKSTPLGGLFWDGGAETFIHRGMKSPPFSHWGNQP